MNERLLGSKEIYPATPKLRGSDLERACAPTMSEAEMSRMREIQDTRPEHFFNAARVLAAMDLDAYLPVEDSNDERYRKNLDGCKNLQRKAQAFVASMRSHELYSEEGKFSHQNARQAFEEYSELAKATRILMASDVRKASWLEREYYPEVFQRTLITARAEVRQFLMKHQNLRGVSSLEDPHEAAIRMRAPASYILNGGYFGSAGIYNERTSFIDMRMPVGAGPRDEWETYQIAVHELIHYISRRGCQWGEGRKTEREREAFVQPQLNEGLTETLTYLIAKEHIVKGKTELFRQRMPDLSEFSYADYTISFAQVLSQIPIEDFIDALVDEQSLRRLVMKFEEVYGKPGAFVSYTDDLVKKFPGPYKPGGGGDIAG